MRIKRLELKNFRGFEELTINFPEDSNVAVFVGVNGEGKTSVLEGIVNLVSLFYKELFEDKIFEEFPLKEKDIRYDKTNLENNINFTFINKNIYNEIKFHQDGHSTRLLDLNKQHNYIENIHKIREHLRITIGAFSPPIIGFYSTDRSVLMTNLNVIDLNKLTPWEIYKDAFNITIDFQNFFKWFRSVEDVENEERVYDNPANRDVRLESIRRILMQSFLNKFSDPRVQRQPKEDLILKKGTETLSFNSLSHGEKLMFALLGDIVRRASVSFPENPLEATGVVLIDEIELHLHPGWQRKIVPLLTKTFPNIQFILTTHSPQVISSVERESVFILKNFKLIESPHTLGRDTNALLYDVFQDDERPDWAKEKLKDFYDLLEKEDVENAEKLLDELREAFGNGDSEIQRAEIHLSLIAD